VSFERVRRLGKAIPGVEEGTAWGTPALKVNGRMLACMAIHSSAEPGSLVVVVPIEEREALIEEQPDVYYIKDHYVAHPSVLVRLARIPDEALTDLLAGAARQLAAKPRRSPSKRRA